MADGQRVTRADVQAPLAESMRFIVYLASCTPSRSSARIEATIFQVRGEMLLAIQDHDGAMDEFGEAVVRFRKFGPLSVDFGRFLYNLAIDLSRLGATKAALAYAEESQKILWARGRRYRRRAADQVAMLKGLLEPEGQAASAERAAELQQLVERFGQIRTKRGRLRAADTLNSAFSTQPPTRSQLAVADEALRLLVDQLLMTNRPARAAEAVLSVSYNRYVGDLALPPWLAEYVESISSRMTVVDTDLWTPGLLTTRALVLAELDSGAALDLALKSVAKYDLYLLSLRSSETRRAVLVRGSGLARRVAFSIATSRGEHALAAELIESSRLQAELSSWTIEQPGNSRLRNLCAISVAGTSRLSLHYDDVQVSVLPIEECIFAVGGPGAVWWGCWLERDSIQWALMVDGCWSSGQEVLHYEERRLKEFVNALSQLPGSVDLPTDAAVRAEALLRGVWSRSPSAELLAATELGESLVPPALKQILIERSIGDNPVSLVMAGNLAGMLPVPLLSIYSDFPHSVRLIEAAVPRIAPPSVVVATALARGQVAAESYRLLIACTDPTNELENSRRLDVRPMLHLAGDATASDRVATADNLRAALSRTAPGQPGIFYYAGHVRADGQGDQEDAFVMSGHAMLHAGEFFTPSSQEPLLGFPSRCLLSACQSSGAAGGGAGEWLGLSAALISAGASHVIATNWPIWDTPYTATLDNRILLALEDAVDPARALREIQLDCLNEWRRSRALAAVEDPSDLFEAAEVLPLPLIWAAYCCTGMATQETV